MIETVEGARSTEGAHGELHMTVAMTDGEAIYASRYASNGPQPSLYHSTPGLELMGADGTGIQLAQEAVLVLSEPLDDLADHWQEVPESSRLEVRAGVSSIGPLFSS